MQGPVDSSSGVPEAYPQAERRRRLWAQSKDSTWHSNSTAEPDQDLHKDHHKDHHRGPGPGPGGGQQNGRVNKISSWLSECRTPIGASLDDHTGSPIRGLRNGCSFEDDLSLGAEANHLLSSPSRSEPGFGLVADKKRTQFKERAHSMNSTGSGKSSTVSSVSELLDLYEEDPEEILLNLGFGREEPDLASKVPTRFFDSSSCARGIDVKVFLGAQLQRRELENPNYALTSRFRQIEVLTSVANEFFQLYSQVSGQPLHRISTPSKQTETEDEPKDAPTAKKTSSPLKLPKLLKKTISKHNLLALANKNSDAQDNTDTNAHANVEDGTRGNTGADSAAGTPADSQLSHPSPQARTQPRPGGEARVKVDASVLSSVSEESTSEGDKESTHSTEQISEPTSNQSAKVDQQANRTLEDAELADNSGTGHSEHSANQSDGPKERTDDLGAGDAPVKTNCKPEEEQVANGSAGDKETAGSESWAVNPQLALLRTENADSFDIEEIGDDVLPQRSPRIADLSRTVSQQSDSSGFAEEPSSDSCSFLKIQESSDSCDSETTVTSHPSQDLATPVPVDHPAFDLFTGGAVEHDQPDGEPELIPQYTAHHLPKSWRRHSPQSPRSPSPTGDEEPLGSPDAQSQSTMEQEPEIQLDVELSDDPLGESWDEDPPRPRQAESPDFVSDRSECSLPPATPSPAPPSPVLGALHRATLHKRLPGSSRARCVPLQRSSSLPSTVVSSVRIQLGRGRRPPPPPDHASPTALPLKAIPPHLTHQSRSLSSSPAPDWHHNHSWSTQSIPEIYTNPQHVPYGPPQYGNPHGSMPNLHAHHSPFLPHGFSPRPEQHPAFGFPHSAPHSAPQSAPQSVPYAASSWLGGSYSSLHSSPHTYFSPPTPTASQYSSHSHYPHMPPPSPYPPAPGFHPSLFGGPQFSHEAAPGPQHMTSSEMQLRRVLQEIRGTLFSLGQGSLGTADLLSERRAPLASPQTLSELLLKRRSLNAFRSQMMELELSILREQAPVYRHLSPSDRLEVEQLQRLRSAVREELQELETQLEERLLDHSPRTHTGMQQASSEDNLSSASALRAMAPVSDLLREQRFLQSELSYHSNGGSSASSRSPSPVRTAGSQGAGHYSTSISITPVPPPRSQPHPSEEQREESLCTEDTPPAAHVSRSPPPVNDLQHLIREIRESVAQEVRREIYSELLASITTPKL